ncbi:MAG: type II toxin-antitoxin system Phd/YefM family antitoxin [Deltaproteobacteria bacterium]|nr:type II toxin-antitoxin system Phd/YefM family antitoxin [Deltaproteobacteria bacterium]
MVKSPQWNVADAKAHLTEVIERARVRPQTIAKRGQPVAVLVGLDEYRKLEALARQDSPARRLGRFLEISAAIREEGGVDLVVPPREVRRDPFAPPRRRSSPRAAPKAGRRS